MPSVSIPSPRKLTWPVLAALKELGGSGTVQEIYERVIERERFTEEQQSVPSKDGRMSQIAYRLNWARTELKAIGAVSNSARGVWAITDKGRQLTYAQLQAELAKWQAQLRAERERRRPAQAAGDTGAPEEETERTWKEDLLDRLLALPPQGFERLAQRLLREAGFINVAVTGRSGDGGIDGVGVYRVSLVSFPLYFQCKRYKGAVGAGAVREFRGAMAGRGEKGLLITTGSFTKGATEEATRDGAPPVELVDGDRLCDLLREYRLGVSVTQRVEEDVTIQDEFFAQYQ